MLASSLCFKTAVLFAFGGFIMGIGMAASGNHSVMPAHAHMALLGWVSLFLFGLYYRLHPWADCRALAQLQVLTWSTGTLVLVVGVTMIYTGHPIGEPIAAVGSIVVLSALLMFATVVFRGAPAESVDEAHVSRLPGK